MLGNIGDFDPETDKLPLDELYEIDRYILHRFRQVEEKIIKAFENFEFHIFYHAFANFCVVDLSAFYLDILKDRLYTYPRNSVGRRSSQTAIHSLLIGMTKLIAPVLSFTADEIWSYIPKGKDDGSLVHLQKFSDSPSLAFSVEQAEKWGCITVLKSEVSKALELRRQEKVIGHSLDALVRIVLPKSLRSELENELADLKYIFIVSVVEVADSLDGGGNIYSSDIIDGLQIEALPAPGEKCPRCWNYFTTDARKDEANSICPRCVDNLESAQA